MKTECVYCGGRLYKTGAMGDLWRGDQCPRCHVLWSNQHGIMVPDRRWRRTGEWKSCPAGVLIVASEREEARTVGRKGLNRLR